jgi:hypothetical protein
LHEAKAQEEGDRANQVVGEKVIFATRFGVVQNTNQDGQKEQVDTEAHE